MIPINITTTTSNEDEVKSSGRAPNKRGGGRPKGSLGATNKRFQSTTAKTVTTLLNHLVFTRPVSWERMTGLAQSQALTGAGKKSAGKMPVDEAVLH